MNEEFVMHFTLWSLNKTNMHLSHPSFHTVGFGVTRVIYATLINLWRRLHPALIHSLVGFIIITL